MNNNLRDRLRARRKELKSTQLLEKTVDDSNVTELEVLSESRVDPKEARSSNEDSEQLLQALSQQRAANIKKFEKSDLKETKFIEDSTQNGTFSTRSSSLFPSAGIDSESTLGISQSGTPSKSGSSLLRSRIQAKLASRRLSEKSKEKSRRIRDRVALSTRFDETLKRYNNLEEGQLNERVAEKLRFKLPAPKNQGQFLDQECFDFFTKEFNLDEELLENEETSNLRDLPAGVTDSQVIEYPENRPLVGESENIDKFLPDSINWTSYEFSRGRFYSNQIKLKFENENYFIPASTPAKMEDKLGVNVKPRYLELEGFYVGIRPFVSTININILENRLLKSPGDGRKWFGVDGRVDFLPCPLKQVSVRPWHADSKIYDKSIETVYVKASQMLPEEKYLTVGNDNELQIDLSSILFHHHHLMSKEHVLASRISLLYNQYVDRRHKNYINFFTEKLATLRNAVSVLQQNPTSQNEIDEDLPTLEDRLYDFMSEIRLTTRQLNIAEMEERDLMRRIIEDWNRIKDLRKKQGYVNTSIKLTIQSEEINSELDQIRWEREVNLEMKERKMEFEATVWNPYREKVSKYKLELKEWKKKRKHQERMRKGLEDDEVVNEDETDGTDTGNLITISGNIDKPQKPVAPPKFNKDQVREAIKESLLKHRRNPGEPRIWLLLGHTSSITTSGTSSLTSDEINRRKAVDKCQIFLKIFFNGDEVFTTERRRLTQDFKVNFGSIFRIVINQWPENLKAKIYEDQLIGSSMIAGMSLLIPEISVNSDNVRLKEVEFVGDREITYDHAGVGSKTRIQLSEDQPTSFLTTRGHLICSLCWGLDEVGEVLAPKNADQVVIREGFGDGNLLQKSTMIASGAMETLGIDVVQDPEALSKWLQQTRIDPNHPDNSDLLPLIEDSTGKEVIYSSDYFRLEQLQERFNFASDLFFEKNRLRMLMLRHKEEEEFRNLTMIPPNDHEILESAFTIYENRLKEKNSLENFAVDRKGLLNEHRLEVLRFRRRIKDAVIHRFHISRHIFTYEDIVHEDKIPDTNFLFVAFKNIFHRERPLRPTKHERKRANANTLVDGQIKLLVNVVRAYNVPVRESKNKVPFTSSEYQLNPGQNRMSTAGETIKSKKFECSPFVAVSFQDHFTTTNISDGPQPNWNEELKLPFTSPGDYSPSTLQTVNDTVYIHLFDRVVDQVDLADRNEDPNIVAYRTHNYWLGSLSLPFSTIYHQGKIEGTYRLKTPPVLLGYTFDERKVASVGTFDDFQNGYRSNSFGTYLNVFITIDPILKPMDPPRLKFETQEPDDLINHAIIYINQCKAKFPKRNVKATVVDIKGESVFITRFISPIKPPAELLELSDPNTINTASRLARFVSLIPTESDNVAYSGVCDLWCTCDQFLHMLCGDEEEHAVLLLNYFLYLGKEAYLLLANAVPEGDTAYVLTIERKTQEFLFWNACTGQYYSHKDPLCPLSCIGAVVNKENIWFNIQPHSNPIDISYNFQQSKDWKPFFTSKYPNPGLSTNQPDSLVYVVPEQSYVSQLADKIERILKERFVSWRARNLTKWNRTGNSALFKIVKELEKSYERRSSEVNHGEIIKEVLGDVQFTGFPMDMPFTDVESIISAVKATEVHKIQERDVEFSLAVHIHAYPGAVFAAWIYIAAIINKRRFQF